MVKKDLNHGWSYRKLNGEENFKPITLPYDCAIHEERSENSPGGCNNAWVLGYDYEFIREITLQETEAEKRIMVEFEGVYHKAEFYCNGERLYYRPNGYLGFYVDLTGKVKAGKNTLMVIARGADIPNSRWYTGVGIYRPVHLYISEYNCIPPNGVRIKTMGIHPAVIQVYVNVLGKGQGTITILQKESVVATCSFEGGGLVIKTIEIPQAALWSPHTPELYTCKVEFCGDVHEERFGIRTISCDAKRGFRINGERIILRGACIHHDNGLLGSATFPEAEERKVKILQQCGFNAIRSAHNPCSKTLLEACDKLGMLVMDEYADGWYIHKTKYDYADHIMDWYERDIADMVEKDFNHPSVVLYSLGNEVTETADEKGVAFYKSMQDCVKKLDNTRPVTCGINIGFNQAAAMGHSFFSDEKAAKNDFKNLGTEEANHRKWMFGPLFTKLNAILPGCDRATRAIFATSDVAGYNYGILRYKSDRRKYPNRIILGSESFCEDAERFIKLAQKDKGIIGDFVWTGFDHMGEVGLGSWEYRDYAPTYIHTKGWLTSGSGRVDITGKILPEGYYMKAAYGLLKAPVIAVKPVNHMGERHSPSGWKYTNSVSSWAWSGYEGKKAEVEVYACASYIELYLNGKKLKTKSMGKHCVQKFKVPYGRGTLTAIAYNNKKQEIGRSHLQSVNEKTELRIEPENLTIRQGELCYVRLRITDENGTTKVLEKDTLQVKVEGGTLMGLGHACPYNNDGYTNDYTSTYWGEALAIVRVGEEGTVKISAKSPKLHGSCQIRVE